MDLTTPPPAGFSKWLECLVYAIGLFYFAWCIIEKLRGEPAHPPNSELEQSHAQLEKRVKILEDNRNRDAAESKKDRSALYIHIDEVRKELKKDIAEGQETTQTVLRAMPREIISILRETGAIGPRHSQTL